MTTDPTNGPIATFSAYQVARLTRLSLRQLSYWDLRRSGVRNLERAGVPRSVAMKMVEHKTEAICRRYAIVDEAMLRRVPMSSARQRDRGLCYRRLTRHL